MLAGRIVLPLGAPREEGMRVLAIGWPFEDGRRERACTPDPDGRFRAVFAEGTRLGALELESRFLLLDTQGVDLDDAPAELVLEPALGARVVGRVRPPPLREGEAPGFEAMRVRISGEYWTLDPDGAFDIGPLRAESTRLEVRSPDWVDEERELALVPGDRARVEIRLERGVRLAGRVIGPDGEGLSDAEVRASSEGSEEGRAPDRALQVHADDGGRFELRGMHAGTWGVRAEAEQHLDSEELLVSLPGEDFDLELVLAPALRVEGVVRAPDGTPVPGARVWAREAGDGRRSPLRSIDASGADGGFSSSELGPGSWRLHASAQGYAASAPVEVQLAPGLEAPVVQLELRRGASVEGRVVFAGEPAPDRRVWARGDGHEEDARTDARGAFRIEDLPPGEYQVGVQLSQAELGGGLLSMYRRASVVVELAEGGSAYVELPPPDVDALTVRGRVSSAGQPVEACELVWTAHGAKARGMTTDAEGRYAVGLERAGTWFLRIADAESPVGAQAVDIRAGEVATVTLTLDG